MPNDSESAERPARLSDVHALARAMPHVTIYRPDTDRPIYQVGSKSFVFFRTPRPDAVDLTTGERYPDVIVFWVPDEADKQALIQDPATPCFSTPHFNGHPSVLIRSSRLAELSYGQLQELVIDAWLSQASARRRRVWLAEHGDLG